MEFPVCPYTEGFLFGVLTGSLVCFAAYLSIWIVARRIGRRSGYETPMAGFRDHTLRSDAEEESEDEDRPCGVEERSMTGDEAKPPPGHVAEEEQTEEFFSINQEENPPGVSEEGYEGGSESKKGGVRSKRGKGKAGMSNTQLLCEILQEVRALTGRISRVEVVINDLNLTVKNMYRSAPTFLSGGRAGDMMGIPPVMESPVR